MVAAITDLGGAVAVAHVPLLRSVCAAHLEMAGVRFAAVTKQTFRITNKWNKVKQPGLT